MGEAGRCGQWRKLFYAIVKWITFGHPIPGQCLVYRAAQADFNVRGMARSLALYCADGLVFCALFKPADLPNISRILAVW